MDNKQKYLNNLINMLSASFNKSELNTLISKLGVNQDDISGQTIGEKASQLIRYLNQRNTIADLIEVCKNDRPNIVWPIPYSQRITQLKTRLTERKSDIQAIYYKVTDRLKCL
jgi:hypothetical protein